MKNCFLRIWNLAFLGPVLLWQGCDGSGAQLSETKFEYESVDWYFQCPSDPNPIVVPPSTPKRLVFEGPGPFQALSERIVNTPVTIRGRVCPPMRMMRDIVFVIDVSGSMSGNDPLDATNTTCGRLTALNLVLDSLPPNIANMAVATFDDDIVHSSDRLYGTKEELISHITNNDSIALKDIFCTARTGTDYVAGLDRAKIQLQMGRQNATKEIFFLSDGEPNSSSDAIAKAEDLKTNGVNIGGKQKLITLATIMLKGDDTVLKQMCSVDINGNLIHAFADHAQDLAAILDRMSDNKLVTSIVKHRGDNAPQWTTINIFPQLQNYEFKLSPFYLDINGSQNFYQVTLEYGDAHQNTFTVEGTIDWVDN